MFKFLFFWKGQKVIDLEIFQIGWWKTPGRKALPFEARVQVTWRKDDVSDIWWPSPDVHMGVVS